MAWLGGNVSFQFNGSIPAPDEKIPHLVSKTSKPAEARFPETETTTQKAGH